MRVKELYDVLDKMLVLHTTRQWKNGWQHEGDVLSEALTIQKEVKWNNMFLLQKGHRSRNEYDSFSLDGPNGFKIEVQMDNKRDIRIDIRNHYSDINIYYYVNNGSDWEASKMFITDLCQNVYDSHVSMRNIMSDVPKVYGAVNPKFTLNYKRDNLLKEIGI